MAIIASGFESYGLLVLRFFLGIIFIYHALPKLSMPGSMASGMGKSKGFVFTLGLIELIAGLSLVLGFYSDLGAIAIALIMLGAIYHKIFKWKVPFFAMDKTGWEFDLILLGASIAVLLVGPGSISLDVLFGIWP